MNFRTPASREFVGRPPSTASFSRSEQIIEEDGTFSVERANSGVARRGRLSFRDSRKAFENETRAYERRRLLNVPSKPLNILASLLSHRARNEEEKLKR